MGTRLALGLVPAIYLGLLVFIVQLGRAVSSLPDLADAKSGPWFQYNRATAEWERIVSWSTTPDPPALNNRAPLSVMAMIKELESGGTLKVTADRYRQCNGMYGPECATVHPGGELDGHILFQVPDDGTDNIPIAAMEHHERNVERGDYLCVDTDSAFALALAFGGETGDQNPTSPLKKLCSVRDNQFVCSRSPGAEGTLYRAIISQMMASARLQDPAYSDNKHFAAYFNLAAGLHARYDFGQAESLYLEALKLQPDHVLARLALAEVYANIGDMFKAHEALKHAERHHHDSLAKTGAGLDAKTTSVLLHTSDDSAYPRRLVMQIRLAIITSIILHKKALNQPYAGLSAFAKQSAARYDQLLDELQWVFGESAGSGRMHTFLTTVLAVLRLNRGILCDLQNNSTGAKTLWELVPEHLLGYLPREYFDRQGALQSPRSGGYSNMKPLPGPLFFMWEHTVLDAEGKVAMHGPYRRRNVELVE